MRACVRGIRAAWAILAACGVWFGGAQQLQAQADPSMPKPDVLIINSYAPGYRWSDDMLAGLIGRVRERHKDFEPVIEFLDLRRFPSPDREPGLLQDILAKVAVSPPRLVVTLDNPAFEFATRHRARIAPGVPLVFGGLNRFVPEMIDGMPKVTGVSEESDYSGTFTLIQHLRPRANRVLVIGNPSPSSLESRRAFEAVAPRYADRYSFEFFESWTNEELFARLESLSDEWVAMILDVTRDVTGRDNYDDTTFYRMMRSRPRVPVFINSRPPGVRDIVAEPWDSIGGGLVVPEVHGRAVGDLIVRVLSGEDVDAIPVVRYSPQQLEVEYSQMKRFGIPLRLLPPGTLVNNAPSPFYQINRTRLIQFGVVLVILVGVIVVLSLNIFWRHRAEHALRRAEEHLRSSQKLEAVGLLAGGVAHDFNNILQVIRGHAGFLRANLAAGMEPEAEDVTIIEDAAERATQLTRQLLAFSRKQALNIGPIDPNALVNDMGRMLKRVLGEHIELRVVPLAETCTLVGDKGQLEQVLLNLCVNARDAMPGGGRIQIELKRTELGPEAQADVPEVAPGPYLVLVVSDNGSGMAPEVRRRLFEPFFTTKPAGKGTGLGLAVVYGVVRQHQGAIRVYSEPGKGTVFRVMLPLRGSAPEAPVTERPAAIARGSGTVLVAEDDAQVRSITERVLRQNGFKVLTAADGQAALDLVNAHGGDIRLAVLDVLMPRLNGRQVFDRLRARHPEIRVLFCSGYSAEMLPPEIAPGDGFALLNKPYTSRELLEQVHRLLDT